jgi:plastocyanin
MFPLLLIGCADASRSTALATPSRSVADASDANASGSQRLVNMNDACDPATFDAAVGPGTCVRPGGTTFAQFIAELTRNQTAGAWRFAAPSTTSASVGQTFLAVNRGGEVHTFTHVAAFGGGIVPPLNALSGNPVPAAECLALEPDDFVAPGATYVENIETAGTQRFQCCIHPWMRITVRVQ